MMHPKILLTCPVNKRKDYVIHEWFEHIVEVAHYYPGQVDFYFVDNSADANWHKELKKTYGFEIDYLKPTSDNREYILKSRQKTREYFFTGPWDYYFSYECDIFGPKDVLFQLYLHQLPVVSAWYFTGLGAQSFPLFIKSVRFDKSKHVEFVSMQFQESMLELTGGLKQTAGNGLGCTLIHKEVLMKIPFRVNYDQKGHDDMFFFQDMFLTGIPHYCDTDIHCEHKNSDWNEVEDFERVE